MTDETTTTIPSLEDWQHWALVMARANQMIMEAWADNLAKGKSMPGFGLPVPHATNDPMAWMTAGRRGLVEGARGVEPDARPVFRGRRDEGPPLRLARMARESDLRHGPAKLSGDQRQAARHGRGDRGARRGRAQPPALRHQGLRRRDEPGQFHGHQPGGDEADDRDQGREFARRASRTCSPTSRAGR